MKYTVPLGKHRARWWWLHGSVGYKKKTIRRKVMFDHNCDYVHENKTDQQDINKLFGIMPVPFWRCVWLMISWPVMALLMRKRHHQDSARVGWWYDPLKKKFIICAYCYVNGQRIIRTVAECFARRELLIVITNKKDYYEISVLQFDNMYPLGKISIPKWSDHHWHIGLGLFFGGNNPAPHTMTIEISKP